MYVLGFSGAYLCPHFKLTRKPARKSCIHNIPKFPPRICVSRLNRAKKCVNVANKCVNTLFLVSKLSMLSAVKYSLVFWGGFDIYASVLLTPSCFLFKQ